MRKVRANMFENLDSLSLEEIEALKEEILDALRLAEGAFTPEEKQLMERAVKKETLKPT